MLCFPMFLCFVFYRSSVSATHIQTHLQYIHIGTYKCKHMPGLQAYRGNLHTQRIVSTHSYASGNLCWSRKTAMTLPRGVRTVEQRWGVKGVGVTKINDLKLSFSPECVCVRVCGLYSGDIMQRKAPSLKDGLV